MTMRPNNYNPTAYFIDISTRKHYDTKCRHNAKEKVTLEDLFLLYSMDGGDIINVPWNVAKFLSDKAKGTKNKSMIVGAHLIRRIARFNGLGQRELVDDMLDDSKDEVVAAEAIRLRMKRVV
ncbi:hypothetical protein Tco_1149990 [Tanacetum coccineum]